MVIINNLYPQVIKVCRPLIIEDEVLKVVAKKFSEAISKGLNAEYVEKSTVKCNLTHVSDFPDGTERGSFIGLDFSGKIFRLVYVGLKGDHSYTTVSRLYEFPDQKWAGDLSKVVEYVARCVNNFIETTDIFDGKLILGVASSFPMEQESLQDGKVLQLSKDMDCNGLNQDFFLQLKLSLKKFKYTKRIYLISLISSSTACLLSALYKDPATRIGLYLGEQTNLTYIEKYKNMTIHTGDGLRPRTALGVEMKNFGDDGFLNFIRTDFDYQIDASSKDPGKNVLEKMISASHLGEIARLCLYKLASLGVILDGYISPCLSMRDALKTSDLAMMEMDEEKKFIRCKAVMRNLGYKKVSDSDCLQIRFVSRCVARRSSNLVAACLKAMIQRMETRDAHIIGDGFLLKEFPNYENYLLKKINQLKKPGIRFHIRKADKEEVGVGAGVAAFIYKDGVIKMEDRHRALPRFDAEKYGLKEISVTCVDCEKEPVKTCQKVQPPVENKENFAEPLFANPFDL